MKKQWLGVVGSSLLLSACASESGLQRPLAYSPAESVSTVSPTGYEAGAAKLQANLKRAMVQSPGAAKNIILWATA